MNANLIVLILISFLLSGVLILQFLNFKSINKLQLKQVEQSDDLHEILVEILEVKKVGDSKQHEILGQLFDSGNNIQKILLEVVDLENELKSK